MVSDLKKDEFKPKEAFFRSFMHINLWLLKRNFLNIFEKNVLREKKKMYSLLFW